MARGPLQLHPGCVIIDRAAATGFGNGRGDAPTRPSDFFLLTATGNRADAAIVVAGTTDIRTVGDDTILNRGLQDDCSWMRLVRGTRGHDVVLFLMFTYLEDASSGPTRQQMPRLLSAPDKHHECR